MSIPLHNKAIRAKASHGVTYTWRVGKNREGKWRPVSVGKPSNRMPMDFAPFEIMDAVLNKHIAFETPEEAKAFVMSL